MAIADLPALPPVKGDVNTPFTVQACETHERTSCWLSSDPGMARPPPAANDVTAGHTRAGGVKHQVKPMWPHPRTSSAHRESSRLTEELR